MSGWRGPIEDGAWPTTIAAHVVEPGAARIHGYAVADDLARHYAATDVTCLAYTGELPTEAQRRLCDLALVLLAPATVAGAPAHAAVLSRLLAAGDANVVAIAAMIAAEEASAIVREHAAWLRWCARPQGPPPPELLDPSSDDVAESIARELGVVVPGVSDHRATPTATALALLAFCGLGDPLRLVALVVQARLPCIVAEAERHTPRHLQSYPIATPPFDYDEDPT
jgi:hypothetical protein